MKLKIAVCALLACAVCGSLALWSLTLGIGLAIVLAFIAVGVSGREYEGYL